MTIKWDKTLLDELTDEEALRVLYLESEITSLRAKAFRASTEKTTLLRRARDRRISPEAQARRAERRIAKRENERAADYFNPTSARPVTVCGVDYISISAAAAEIGVTRATIRARIIDGN